ncbi:hypothetical protein PsorP6_002641 [Peronosclerospora sorghi]|uniref:Uncharacterized protein n=1 Tax=Peronosclerospora sorghi TaxID=230839 RepID=A0ACC0WUF2_9STRA|nr:hypothetical protein PsorP6_002641 [Peronosclerospora sorghi]
MVAVDNVLHIPNLYRRLISVLRITAKRLGVHFGATKCGIWKGDELLISAKRDRNIYTLYVAHEKSMHEHAMYVAHEENQVTGSAGTRCVSYQCDNQSQASWCDTF